MITQMGDFVHFCSFPRGSRILSDAGDLKQAFFIGLPVRDTSPMLCDLAVLSVGVRWVASVPQGSLELRHQALGLRRRRVCSQSFWAGLRALVLLPFSTSLLWTLPSRFIGFLLGANFCFPVVPNSRSDSTSHPGLRSSANLSTTPEAKPDRSRPRRFATSLLGETEE
jgi:hypothetical protein